MLYFRAGAADTLLQAVACRLFVTQRCDALPQEQLPAAFLYPGVSFPGGPTNEAGLADPKGSVCGGAMPQFARSKEWLLEP